MDNSPSQPQSLEQPNHAATRGRLSWLILVAKIALAAGIVAWLCTGRLELRRFANVPLSLNLVWLVAIVFGSMFLPAVRWWWLLRIQKIDVSLWRATKLTWLGYAAALVMPGAASGDLAKSCLIFREQSRAKARSVSTVFVDRIIGVYSLVLLGCLSAAWLRMSNPDLQTLNAITFVLFALFCGSTLGMALAVLGPTRRLLARALPLAWVEAWTESYQLYAQSVRALAGCLVLSLIGSVSTAASLAAADRAMGGAVSWTASLLIGPLVVLANCLPITPGGIGVAEATASGLFTQAGSANGAEMMLAIRLVMAILSLPALLILFGGRRKLARSSTTSSAAAIPAEAIIDAQQRVPRAA
jgi:uncharacterized membrane protein YbhN (UPF0104 family)